MPGLIDSAHDDGFDTSHADGRAASDRSYPIGDPEYEQGAKADLQHIIESCVMPLIQETVQVVTTFRTAIAQLGESIEQERAGIKRKRQSLTHIKEQTWKLLQPMQSDAQAVATRSTQRARPHFNRDSSGFSLDSCMERTSSTAPPSSTDTFEGQRSGKASGRPHMSLRRSRFDEHEGGNAASYTFDHSAQQTDELQAAAHGKEAGAGEAAEDDDQYTRES
eukprot:TRINITY_DN2693_c0_g1_i1.p1 TRINITY_DN2693_c0_g1~~TRINITY_DN2693_c0_g1_i1.p1  ORF type:complete len:221 (-),score=42.64 TRINITY_DN2693_c0_g1_i1:522-1184(-)